MLQLMYKFTAWLIKLLYLGFGYLELRKPSYHGIFWQKLNPKLPEWFSENQNQNQNQKQKAT